MAQKPTSGAAGRAVAKRGIVLGSAYNDRSPDGSRFPEKSRKAAQAGVRKARERS